jgi:3-oxoacyl-[acyl-carrier protein] reductase
MEGQHVQEGNRTNSKRVALVMAASKGLGRASAEALGRSGYRLVLCSRSEENVQAAVSELASQGVEAIGVPSDVSRLEDLEKVFERVDQEYGRLDTLVANAGGPPPGTFLQVSESDWETAFELTLMSAVRAMRLALPRMQAQHFGRIIVIASSSVKQPIGGLVLSNAFRPALLGVVKTLSQEMASQGITVNLVAPGRIDTERVRSLDRRRAEAEGVAIEQVRAASEKTIPAGRYGAPADLGALVGFLASEEAGYITGQSILVDGGMVSAL